jgi:hypothetical protein
MMRVLIRVRRGEEIAVQRQRQIGAKAAGGYQNLRRRMNGFPSAPPKAASPANALSLDLWSPEQ